MSRTKILYDILHVVENKETFPNNVVNYNIIDIENDTTIYYNLVHINAIGIAKQLSKKVELYDKYGILVTRYNYNDKLITTGDIIIKKGTTINRNPDSNKFEISFNDNKLKIVIDESIVRDKPELFKLD